MSAAQSQSSHGALGSNLPIKGTLLPSCFFLANNSKRLFPTSFGLWSIFKVNMSSLILQPNLLICSFFCLGKFYFIIKEIIRKFPCFFCCCNRWGFLVFLLNPEIVTLLRKFKFFSYSSLQERGPVRKPVASVTVWILWHLNFYWHIRVALVAAFTFLPYNFGR